MSQPPPPSIPPLLCNTPPPIDFDDANDDDDFDEDFETTKTEEYEGVSLPSSPEHKIKNIEDEENLDLPPLPNDLVYSLYSNEKVPSTFKSIEVNESENSKGDKSNTEKLENENAIKATEILSEEFKIKTKTNDDDDDNDDNDDIDINSDSLNENQINEKINQNEIVVHEETESTGKHSRGDSPQSLELYTTNLSEDDDDDNNDVDGDDDNDSIGAFQAANEINYDDNTSLPSLKFDSIGISKSNTPILFDDKGTTIQVKELNENLEKHEDISVCSALQSTSSQSELTHRNIELLTTNTIAADNDNDSSVVILENDKEKEDNSTTTTTEIFYSHISEHCSNDGCLIDGNVILLNHEQHEENPIEILKNDTNNSNMFEADFSQFESYQSNISNNEDISKKIETIQENLVENSISINKNFEKSEDNAVNDDDDDDFEDFQDFTTAPQIKSENSTEQVEKTEKEEDNDFDEFGNFESSPSTVDIVSSNLKLQNLDEKIKSILNLMFPIQEDVNINENIEEYIHLNTDLVDVDSAVALGYQWSSSNVKQSLIKALGIDSRNILYGEKWNSSLPRFAANLVYNPLEPLKPVKIGNDAYNSMSSSLLSHQRNTVENASSSSNVRGKVPEVEFDWNSSGLVNPLDASHAHTLLLDLEQLVVVANLDKIKLDSSSPCTTTTTTTTAIPLDIYDYLNITTTSTSTETDILSSITTVKIKSNSSINVPISSIGMDNKQNNIFMDYNNDALPNNDRCNHDLINTLCLSNGNGNFGGGGGGGDGFNCNNYNNCSSTSVNVLLNSVIDVNNIPTTATTTYSTNSNRNDFFDEYLDFRIKEILRERKTETIHTTELGNDNESNRCYEQQPQTIEETNVDINNKATTDGNARSSSLSNINNDIMSKDIISTEILENPEEKLNQTCAAATTTTSTIVHQTNNEEIGGLDGSIISHSTIAPSTFVFPLKETHIFTPTKSTEINLPVKSLAPTLAAAPTNSKCDDKETIDFDYQMAAAGIIIDEKVVKKEYRDVEYNPTTCWNLDILEEKNFDISKKNNSEEFNSSNIVTNYSEVFSGDSLSSTTATCIIPDVKDTIKEIQMADDFSDFLSANSNNKEKIISTETNKDVFKTVVLQQSSVEKEFPIKSLDNFDENVKNKINFTNDSNTIDDDFSEFQSVPPSASQSQMESLKTSQSLANIPPINQIQSVVKNKIVEEKLKSRTGTPNSLNDEMILSPAILLPQAIKLENNPKIEWPEPGINPEELARIEELFPSQGKHKKLGGETINKISLSQSMLPPPPPAPTSSSAAHSTLSTNVSNDDDDDWSDFVSVPAINHHRYLPSSSSSSSSIQQQQPSIGINSNVNKITNNQSTGDDEWSDFVSSTPIQWNPSIQTTASPAQGNLWNPIGTIRNTAFNNSFMPQQNNVPTKFNQGKTLNNNNNISQYLLHRNSVISDHQPPPIPPSNCFSPLQQRQIQQQSYLQQNHHHHQHQHHQQQQQQQQKYQYSIQQQHQLHQQQQQQQNTSNKSQLMNQAPSISLIPDLGFVAPRSLINIPRTTI